MAMPVPGGDPLTHPPRTGLEEGPRAGVWPGEAEAQGGRVALGFGQAIVGPMLNPRFAVCPPPRI